ncbi:MAG: histidinol-phosphatase [Hyphomicrobiaceae bacterium]|nr:histidinol-phosphatase [Hyphomicrobiaceae bacterium]MCC0024098.1 histidinol-phosphatase [Hyphomicrobiaceae bacterium]
MTLPDDLDIARVEATLRAAATAAAGETLPRFRNNVAVDNKYQKGFDPVTEADRNSELAIRRVISVEFPGHNIIGEEHPNLQTGSPFTWTIDPIDGTRAFISGLPVWGTLIGVSFEGRNFAGSMSQPFTGELFLGLPDNSIWERGSERRTLKTKSTTELDSAILFTTTPALFTGDLEPRYKRLEQSVMLARYGCDCYAFCLLAAGHADIVIEAGLNSYDIAALIPLIENAGGIITTIEGKPADQGGHVIAAATPELHRAALERFNA